MRILFFLSLTLFSLCFGQMAFGQPTGEALERQAWNSYEKGYDSTLSPEDQAKHFDEAARLYEEAAKAYEKAEQPDKAKGARKMANGARQNAEHRRKMAQKAEDSFYERLNDPPGDHSGRSPGSDARGTLTERQTRATGRTTGHVADLLLPNSSPKPMDITLPGSVVIPSDGRHQGYAIPTTPGKVTVPPGQTVTIPLDGYCTHPDLPAAPVGTPLPGLTDWPPTVLPTPQTVRMLETTARRLHDRGVIRTPFDDPGIVVQHSLWDFVADYDPCARLRRQMEDAGVPQDAIPNAIAQVVDAMLTTGREAGLPGYQPTLPILPIQPAAPPAPGAVRPTATVTSTGQTTGHIGNITVSNPTDLPIYVVIGGGGSAYIPSQGKDQPYVVPSLPLIPVPPQGKTTTPIHGYCADVGRSPVREGNAMPSISEWITTLIEEGVPDQTNVVRIPTAVAPPLSEVIRAMENTPLPPVASKWDCPPLPPTPGQPLLPGTNTPIRTPITASENPGLLIPILLEGIRRIEDAYDQLRGTITTPFSNNPPKEREAIIQQTFWMYSAGLEGKPYVYQDFRDNTVKQFEDNTGRPYSSLPPDQKEKLDKGVDDFWVAFTATGAEAKVIPKAPEKPTPNTLPREVFEGKPRASSSTAQPATPATPTKPVTGPRENNPPPPEEDIKDDPCNLNRTERSIPDYDIQFDISSSAVEQDKLKEAKGAMEKMIREFLEKGDDEFEYGAPAPLAATYSLWAIRNIGGYAKAVSKALVSNRYGFWNGFINNTEKIRASSKGERILVMSGRNDNKCKTTVVGVGMVFLTAHTVAFDPAANNIAFLRGINFAGKVAIEIAKAYLTGGASLAKSARAKKAVKEAIKGTAKDWATEQVGKILESEDIMSEEDFSDLMDWVNAIKDEEVKEKILKDLAEAMGIDTKWLTFDLEPADFAPVASDTYCKMKGKIDLTVGTKSGSIAAESKVRYKRSNLGEDPKDVMQGGGTHCPSPLILSDVLPGSLTIKLKGLAETEAQAQGNGTAQGFLSSGVVLVQYAICVCPDEWKYDLRVESDYFNGKPGSADINMMKIRFDILQRQVNEYAEQYKGQPKPPNPQQVKNDLEKIVNAWAKEYACKE